MLGSLNNAEWNELLALCDNSQLTLLLGHLCSAHLPEWVRERIDKNQGDNAFRFERIKAATFEIADCFAARAIEFALLKGVAHSPALTPDPLLRAQGDIDIWCRPEKVGEAREALIDLGYRSIGKSSGRHLDPMIRETNWEWRGDYFARDLPVPVDLHYQLWDEELERLPGPVEKEIWERRVSAVSNQRSIPALGPEDTVTFAALHVMMHLLHGDLRLQRAWELAYVLQTRLSDDRFWERWHQWNGEKAREIQLVAFALSHCWFGGELPGLLQDAINKLSPEISLWIESYAWSPVDGLFAPNKDELWLNLALLRSFKDKVRVASRRLLPLRAARLRSEGSAKPRITASDGRRLRGLLSSFPFDRAAYHLRTLPSTGLSGLHWWWQRQQLGKAFLTFLLASVLFDFGEFVFFLLYNLYLLDRRYTEQFIGQVSAAVTAGTFVAILPVAAITRRVGLQRALMIAILGTATATTLRALVPWPSALLGSAFLNGAFMSFWAVSMPPAIAGLTNPRNRMLAFSLITSLGIGVGGLAGLIGGRLPTMFVSLVPGLAPASAKQSALLVGCALAVVAIIPALLLRFPVFQVVQREKKVYPQSRFVYFFLGALFIWSLGTAGFNALFNVYFSRHLHFTAEGIGLLFSNAQMAQVAAILLAPMIAVRLGEVKSITFMQLATAAMLGLLGFVSNPVLAGIAYVAYMCFQYMSEPCLFSMLMTRVSPSEQSGASAMNFLIMSLAGILAALLTGALFPALGYRLTLSGFATVTGAAALVFYRLMRR